MNLEDKVLELVKEKALPIHELQTKLQVSSVNMISVLAFLQKYKLVGVTPTSQGDTVIKITERGLQLLNLPNLSEDESSTEQLEMLKNDEEEHGQNTYLFTKTKDKTINLYPLYQHTETANWIDEMATRYGVSSNDVICALWAIAKDTVGTKLERDVKDLKKRQKDRKVGLGELEFSEDAVNAIKAREDKRQREIAEAEQ